MRVILRVFFFFDSFGRSSIISSTNISGPTFAINRSPAILKAEMTPGASTNGTTSLPGYSLFPWEIHFKFSYKSAKNWNIPRKNPNLASVARTIAGASNMKYALSICTACQVFVIVMAELDKFLSVFHIFVIWRKFCPFKSLKIHKNWKQCDKNLLRFKT